MSRDRNILRRYQRKILRNDVLKFNVIVDQMISKGYLNETLYREITNVSNESLNFTKSFKNLYKHLMLNEKLLDAFLNVLKEEHRQIYESFQKDRGIVDKALAFGGVPVLPPHHIERTNYVTKLHEKLVNLKDNGFLIVHGLAGMGKSSLVNDVIQDPVFLEDHKIFWLNLGDLDNMDLFMNKLRRLHNMATKWSESESLPPNIEDLDDWGYHLRTLFASDNLKSSVLILDDIKCPDVLKYFVKYPLGRYVATTQDRSGFRDLHVITSENQLEVGGLSRDDTMTLLSSALEVHTLPAHFKEAYDLCHGSPISTRHLCTFLMDHKDMALKNVSVFKELSASNENHKFLYNAIGKNVDKLSEIEQNFFHSLAVIPEHVNVALETLEILWPEMSKWEIFNTMTRLMDKSLVTGFYDMSFDRQIYGIHELVKRNYLNIKAETFPETMKRYHKILIDSYDGLPQDCETYRYLLAYYGHHLKGAGLMEGFSKFLDFDFIKHKLTHLGPCDLISDFKTYENYIVGQNGEAETCLENMKVFVQKYHWMIRDHPDTYMEQYMLFDKNEMYETIKARVIQDERKLFFDFEKDHEQVKVTGTVIEKDVTVVELTSANSALIGKSNGDIHHKSFRKEFEETFRKHSYPVDFISHNPQTKNFISHSKTEKFALFWTTPPPDDDHSRPPKSPNYRNLHFPPLPDRPDVVTMKDPITALAISKDGDEDVVVKGSKRGSVGTFSRNGDGLSDSVPVGFEVTDIVKIDAGMLAVMRDGAAPPSVYRFDFASGQFYRGSEVKLEHLEHSRLFFVPRVSREEVAAVGCCWFWIVRSDGSASARRLVGVDDEGIACGAFTRDEQNLVLGSVGVLYVYQMTQAKLMTIRLHSSFRVMSIWTEGPDLVYFVTYDDDKLRCHELRLPPQDKRLVDNADVYTCYWRDCTPIYPLVSDNNHIDIYMGRKVIRSQMMAKMNISCLCFSQDKKKILVGSREGAIWRFSLKTKNEPIEIARFTDLADADGVIKIKSFSTASKADMLCSSTVSSNNDGGIFVASTRRQVLSKIDDGAAVVSNFDETPIDFAVIYIDAATANCSIIAVVDRKCNVTLLTLEGRKLKEFFCKESCDAISVCFHNDSLAMLSQMKDESYRLQVLNLGRLDVHEMFDRKLSSRPTSLAFSFDGELLAVGYASGKIQVINLESGDQVNLDLHQKPITYLLFMPFGLPILVSLGEKAAWWDLRRFQKKDELYQMSEKRCVKVWSSKEPNQSVPYLLSSLNFQGNHLQYVTASADFLTFLIIDSVRNVYKLQVIRED